MYSEETKVPEYPTITEEFILSAYFLIMTARCSHDNGIIN